jgi:isoquinoline 1-oxidoreductase alpha subunit
MEYSITCNGSLYTVDVDPEKPLLWVLREELNLSGTKYSCGTGICGACNVLLSGNVVRSCMIQIAWVGDHEVTTIEGLNDSLGTIIKDTWFTERVSQCGYCQPGQIVAAYDLLSANPDPSDDDIDEALTGLCRCGTYQRIRVAVKAAAARLKKVR